MNKSEIRINDLGSWMKDRAELYNNDFEDKDLAEYY